MKTILCGIEYISNLMPMLWRFAFEDDYTKLDVHFCMRCGYYYTNKKIGYREDMRNYGGEMIWDLKKNTRPL